MAYLATSRTEYPSGEEQGNILRWDLDSGKTETLFVNAAPLLATTQEIFVLQLGETASYPTGIYRIRIADGGIERISNLPGETYSSQYEAAFLARKITKEEENQENTYLYLIYPNHDYTRQDFNDGFVINVRTGEIKAVE